MKTPFPMFLVTDLRSGQTYVLEPSRRGSRKLNCSVMPAHIRVGDRRIPYRAVPLYIRRAAREALQCA